MRNLQGITCLVPGLLVDLLIRVQGAQRTSLLTNSGLPRFSHDGSLHHRSTPQTPVTLTASAPSSWYPLPSANGTMESMALSLVMFQQYWPSHVFGDPKQRNNSTGFFGDHDGVDWCVLGATTVAMVVLDITVIQPKIKPASTSGISSPGKVLILWLSLGLFFNIYIGLRHGLDDAMKWCNGYLLEWLLSMDNLFVFHLVFQVYKTPVHLLHRALFWGILGAILFRMLFFIALGSLLHILHWFRYVFGVLLIVSGIQAAMDDEEDPDLENSYQVKCLRWLLQNRLMKDPNYEENGRLFVWKNQDSDGTGDSDTHSKAKLQISMLVPVIICLEITDIFFAVDSVSAKVAQIPDQYVAYSSSVFAMFGLRALFFIVEDLINRLHLLKYGLCFILVFIGAELILSDYVRLPATAVCLLLISVFSGCVVLSLLFPQKQTSDDAAP